MNSQQLLIINFIIFATLVLFYVLGRSKHKQNITLDLKTKTDPTKSEVQVPQAAVLSLPTHELKTQSGPRDVTPTIQKEVVYFVFNGHEWEAHEILGVKPGSGIDQITQHYQHLIKTADPSTFEIYDAAFTAILRLKGNRW